MRYSRIQVGKKDAGQRLDVFLAAKFSRSRSAVRANLEGAVLSADGRKLKWSHRLRTGEVIRVAARVHPEPDNPASRMVMIGILEFPVTDGQFQGFGAAEVVYRANPEADWQTIAQLLAFFRVTQLWPIV